MLARDRLMKRLRRAMGLPWYGGRPLKPAKVDTMVDQAIKVATGSLEILEAITPAPPATGLEHEAEHAGELLLRGMQQGLAVGLDICQGYREARQVRSFEQMDPKMARLASDTAGWMCRLGAKVMEEAFRRRRDDTVGKLLEQLRVEPLEPEKK